MSKSFSKSLGFAGFSILALATPALASDMTPAPEGREFSWSVNAALTTDYVFRGVSQSDNDPAVSAGFDASYGIVYAGLWASSVDEDFVNGNLEIDYYAGIKPTLGPATFDFGVLYYTYPGASDFATGENEVFELKAAVSGEIFKNLSGTAVLYWSPEAQADAGEYFVYEASLAYALPKISIFTPTISGTYGYVDNQDFDTDYGYWNAGLALGYDKFTFDFRYWDTDSDGEALFGDLSDERFVFTAKVLFP
jgi:uncharacterized protein (TIGR02001 family)